MPGLREASIKQPFIAALSSCFFTLKLQLHNLVQVGLGYALKQMANYAFALQQIKIIQ